MDAAPQSRRPSTDAAVTRTACAHPQEFAAGRQGPAGPCLAVGASLLATGATTGSRWPAWEISFCTRAAAADGESVPVRSTHPVPTHRRRPSLACSRTHSVGPGIALKSCRDVAKRESFRRQFTLLAPVRGGSLLFAFCSTSRADQSVSEAHGKTVSRPGMVGDGESAQEV